MSPLKRIGLQKRISLYVAAGLVIMFGVFAYLGIRAIQHSTALVFQERQALAEALAVGLSQGFEHVAEDVRDEMKELTSYSDRLTLETTARSTLYHLAEVDKFPFFKVSGLWLITEEHQIIAALPQPLPTVSIPTRLWDNTSHTVFRPAESGTSGFVLIGVPLADNGGRVWGVALVNTEAINNPQPFTSLGLLNPAPRVKPPRQSQYQLQVLGPDGIVLLAYGSPGQVGSPSSHLPVLQSWMESGESYVLLYHSPDSSPAQEHVMAVAPVPGTDLYLTLEQEQDIALALPNELRRQLMIFGGAGLVMTLLVAWVTTRRVVKPVEILTNAAEQMALGELSIPVTVRAQDEIGRLAESLEVMRQQLNSALKQIEQANRELESRVKERTQQLQEALKKVISAQEEERRRLARELHDETAQALGALSFLLDNIRDKTLAEPAAAQQQAAEAKELTTRLLEETRRLIFDLRPTVLDDFGLAPALRWYAERHLEDRGIKVSFQAQTPNLPLHIQVAMFRIAQEAINNIAKHAQANQARIELSTQPKTVTLVVEDNGQGFDTGGEWDQTSKVGLVGMRERAYLLGAKLEIRSRPGQGTQVYLEVPVEADNG